MAWHTIEIDNDVFQFLKQKAEPLVDSANSVLRRELLGREEVTVSPALITSLASSATGVLPSLSFDFPEALRQTLEVVYLVRRSRRSRPEATQFVARQHGVAPQTVLDKYCRQLGLTADKFDSLLRDSDLGNLRRLLTAKFPRCANEIRDLLESWSKV